jgi:hypothetical protein
LGPGHRVYSVRRNNRVASVIAIAENTDR